MPRTPLCPSDDEMFPFQFKRKQFPIRLSFAMTVNKAQGQTIPNAGIYLPEPVFSHGQLYVALSRSTARKNIKILIAPTTNNEKNVSDDSRRNSSNYSKNKSSNNKKKISDDSSRNSSDYRKNKSSNCPVGNYTRNIVYREVLTS